MTGGGSDGPARLPVEIAFLRRYGVDEAVLRAAAATAGRAGVTADRALLSEGGLPASLFYAWLADHLAVPFLRGPLPVDRHLRLDRAVDAGMVRLEPNPAGLDYVLAPRGPALRLLLTRAEAGTWSGQGRVAVTTPQRLAALVRRNHRAAIVSQASDALPDWDARFSARAGARPGQIAAGLAAAVGVAYGAWAAPAAVATVLGLTASLVFLAMVAVRGAASLNSPPLRSLPPPRRPDGALPVYTVVVPLYRERRVVPRLVAALRRLDYPAAKLDIKLVVEADDRDTRAALERERLPDRFEVLVAPEGRPRTKPRALNVALHLALGRFLVVYDAEDVPEPGQLRAAAARFEAADARLGCLQGRLAIDNPDDSWLSGLFALEYAALFDVVNPGLARLGLPLPLGGTSNHFRTDALRAVYGWDAWNVTEDVDLGIRLARFGYRIAMLDSSTFEEAPHRAGAWLAQRRRWHKGWVITLLTHTRDLDRLFGDLGVRAAAAVLALLAGTVATALFWPLFAVLLLADVARGGWSAPPTGPRLLAATVAAAGLAGLLGPLLLGLRRRGLRDQAGRLALLPAYLALASLATWQALVELTLRPYSWSKTEHGTAKHRRTPI